MKQLEASLEKQIIYRLLDEQREFVIDPDTGNVVRREAWEKIDLLLEQLNTLNDNLFTEEVGIEWVNE